jgi:phosphatidylinositol alpha-1,6-mannosyltransferase
MRAQRLPSSKEGFGIVYLEAWQHGLPVICSSKGAPKEIVADGVDGFVVDPEDIQ